MTLNKGMCGRCTARMGGRAHVTSFSARHCLMLIAHCPAVCTQRLMSSYAHLSDIPTYASTSTARLKSLYSEFAPQKHSNPSSYASNIEWWRRTLEAVTLHGWQPRHHAPSSVQDRLVLNAEGITFSERFRYDGVGRPLSLATVIVS